MTRTHDAVFVGLLLLASLRSQSAIVEPTFASGDLDQLTCRIVDVKAVTAVTQLLFVEVQNRGSAGAEPMEFQIELRDRQAKAPRLETYQRVQLPQVRRFGRPTPAGGKLAYVLATNLAGKKPQYAVKVTSACWYGDGAVTKPDLRISAPVQVQCKSLAGEFPVTQVELQNPFDRDMDVLLLVTLTQPADSVELMGLRLAAGTKRSWLIPTRAGARSYFDADAPPGCAMKATVFQVIDWSLVASVDPASGAALLRPAYERWYRWPSATLAVSGQFTLREHRQQQNSKGYDTFTIAGRFTLPATGDVVTEITSGSGINAGPGITEAFGTLRRPDFAALAAANQLVQLTADRVEIRGPGLDHSSGSQISTAGSLGMAGLFPDVQVAGDRIVSQGSGGSSDERAVWQTQDLGRGYVVAQRRSKSVVTTYSYGEQGGLIVPLGLASTTTFGDTLFSATELTLTDLRFDGSGLVQAQAPGGDGADAMRAFWEAGYRLPSAPIQWTAAFEVTNPGTDNLWRGRKRVKGKVATTGIGRHMQSIHFIFEGDLSAELEMGLAAAFRDRLLMWYGRDFNDRPSFDEYFRGAVIQTPTPSGTFRIEHGPVAEVVTEGGLVRGFKDADGTATRFTYEKVDGRMVVTRIDSEVGSAGNAARDRWTETVTLRFSKVGELLLPNMLHFERIFGRDWGPETIVLKDLEVH